ncbi:MAG TPA: ATP-binding protein [Candidatus Sutterella merdavium]|nr:ATP-binding protein [Candidatus Sutterella merdavium]
MLSEERKNGPHRPLSQPIRRSDAARRLEERERIYEKFFRGTSSAGHEGSGVGLSVVKRIADRCGWRVNLESSPKGTCFTVTLTGAKVKRMDERG